MAEIIPFKKKRKVHMRGAARQMLSEAMDRVGKPVAVVIYAHSEDGTFAVRTVHEDSVELIDVLARAETAINVDKRQCIEEPEHEYRD